MSEIELTPAAHPSHIQEGAGDCTYEDADLIEWNSSLLRIGRDNDPKAPVNFGIAMLYDTSVIPLGSTVTRARVDVLPNATQSGAFTLRVAVMAPNPKLGEFERGIHRVGFRMTPKNAGGSGLWANQVTTSDFAFRRRFDGSYGVGHFYQAWTASANDTVTQHTFRGRRTGTANAGSLRMRVYRAAGLPGQYVPGTLLGEAVSGTSIDAVVPTSVGDFTIGGLSVPVQSGNTYISELLIENSSGTFRIELDALFAPPRPNDNMAVIADTGRVLQGFAERSVWLRGDELEAAGVAGTPDSVAAPAFTLDTLHSFGTVYTVDTALPNFLDNVQAALDLRTSTNEWIAVTFTDFTGTVDDRQRQVRGVLSGTPTRDALFGPILVLDVEGPPAVPDTFGVSSEAVIHTKGMTLEPVVGVRGLDTRPAIRSKGLGTNH